MQDREINMMSWHTHVRVFEYKKQWQRFGKMINKLYWSMVYMGLLPDTQNCGCACAGNAGNIFPATDFKGNR